MSDHYRSIEDVLGCKWSVSVLQAIADGVSRPGALERHVEGISTKVLNERLKKLAHYHLIEKEQFPEVPPRTEYRLSGLGERVMVLVRGIRDLNEELAARPGPEDAGD